MTLLRPLMRMRDTFGSFAVHTGDQVQAPYIWKYERPRQKKSTLGHFGLLCSLISSFSSGFRLAFWSNFTRTNNGVTIPSAQPRMPSNSFIERSETFRMIQTSKHVLISSSGVPVSCNFCVSPIEDVEELIITVFFCEHSFWKN